ncbi:MAG TPA: ATP-binding protein, partial [Puia sp.]|nr:ATP-binding protein [Puia sp.]
VNLAQVIATNSVSTIRFQDNEAARNILSELLNVVPDIDHAAIFDSSGRLFASYDKQGVEKMTIPQELKDHESLYTEKMLFVRGEILNYGDKIGTVVLQVELTELNDIKTFKYKLATVLLLVGFGFSFLIAIIMQTYISRRLLRLVDAMKEVSRTGDYSKSIMNEGSDEIGTLGAVYNNLMLQVRENQRRKDEFIGIASHELKTPLTSIKGYLELLIGLEEKEPNKLFTQKAIESVGKLEKLINDLLDVSKIQSGQLELNKQVFDLQGLLEETIFSFQMTSKSHQIVRGSEPVSAKVQADKQRIEQVLFNLFSNAVKYSPGEKKIIVIIDKGSNEATVKIRDFGIGVSKDEQSNIFERFYRSKDTSIHISGFGLGLYICMDIIKRHGGRMWVETEKKGSSFYFTLPLVN